MNESLEIVERIRGLWPKTWNFNYRGWQFFEAVVFDEDEVSYTLSIGVMGNKYLYISTAWIATGGEWHFLNKSFFTKVSHSSDGWRTSDGQLESFFDPECGYEVLVESPTGKLDLRFIPNPDVYFWDEIKEEEARFDLFLYNHCQVRGYLTVNGIRKRVKGTGSVEHFYGRFAEKLYWEYCSIKNRDFSLYFRTARSEERYLSRSAILYTPQKTYEMLSPSTCWQEEDNQVKVSAQEGEQELQLELRLALANPDNAKQPYINFHFPLFRDIYANVFEYCGSYNGFYKDGSQLLELSGEGIAHLTEAVW